MKIKYKNKNMKKKLTAKKIQRGSIGNFFVFGVLALLVVVGITAVGGLPSSTVTTNGTTVEVITPTQGATHNTLQLQTFGYVTLAPTPTQAPLGATPLCGPGAPNVEPIIAATLPAEGQTVTTTDQIKVWVDDEGAPMIAPKETTNADGSIATKGNQYALAPDNYLYEPALYLDSATAETGGTPYFPDYIKGQVNNNPPSYDIRKSVNATVPIDPLPAGASTAGCLPLFPECYKSEYVWKVSSLGLTSGTHRAEFVIHDGDVNRGVGCINFQVQ